MVKIVKKRFIGYQDVYDIGLERDHCFVLENGVIASNCFNKSHSTSYAYITFQTAYLKTHYPLEFYTSLLNSHIGDQDKVTEYTQKILVSGIEVKKPDINKSESEFLLDNKRIYFGLSAIRCVGKETSDLIVAERKENGLFQSLNDFIERVNKRTILQGKVLKIDTLTALIYAGCFDSLSFSENSEKQTDVYNHRRLLLLKLEETWDFFKQIGQNYKEELESGQLSLGLNIDINLERPKKSNSERNLEKDESLSQGIDLLEMERKMLGLSLTSSHELIKNIRIENIIYSLFPIYSIKGNMVPDECPETTFIIGASKNVRNGKNREGKIFTLLKIYNQDFEIDSVINKTKYSNWKVIEKDINELKEGDKYLFIGTKKANQKLFQVYNMIRLDLLKFVFIKVSLNEKNESYFEYIQEMIRTFISSKDKGRGTVKYPLFLKFESAEYLIRLGEEYWVRNIPSFVKYLENIKIDYEYLSVRELFSGIG